MVPALIQDTPHVALCLEFQMCFQKKVPCVVVKPKKIDKTLTNRSSLLVAGGFHTCSNYCLITFLSVIFQELSGIHRQK